MDTQSCGVCRDHLTEGAKCSVCHLVLHYQCAGVTETGFRKLGDRRLTWRCAKCKQSTTTSEQNSPKLDTESRVLKEIRAISAKLAPLELLAEDIKALRSEFAQLQTSVIESNKTITEFNIKIKDFEQRLAQVEKIQNQVNTLQAQINKSEEEINARDQWSRMNNLEIKGIPQNNGENLFDILTTIGAKIQYPITKNQINFITRVPTLVKDNIKPIIVCFNNRFVKEDFIAAARISSKSSAFTAAYFGLPGQRRVFINDHLTAKNKLLLSKAKKAAAVKDFRYIWVKHAKIHIRKNDTSPVLVINSEKDLTKII
ncbi:uncharacterized protein LOC119190552 [Manduca sexta]|uniref:uncharacterized protein LOC119190552 n=1 Tax=Manduca sexta TaxID=7130 RepID=UPI001182AE79|nr:uncharacterized protein LOC119190552 [Manduca sexta]